MGWLKSLFAALRGNRKTESTPIDPDDIVARNGLSYGPASDPISNEARVELERQKSWLGAARH
jgi:hypothetical protein